MEQVNIGVIGIGNMGSGHAKRIAEGQIRGLNLYAVADINASRLEWARNTLPDSIKCYESAELLLEDENIDAILIATPHYDHPNIAIKAMKKEIHVLSEKPAGVYTKQVRLMNEEAQKHDNEMGPPEDHILAGRWTIYSTAMRY